MVRSDPKPAHAHWIFEEHLGAWLSLMANRLGAPLQTETLNDLVDLVETTNVEADNWIELQVSSTPPVQVRVARDVGTAVVFLDVDVPASAAEYATGLAHAFQAPSPNTGILAEWNVLVLLDAIRARPGMYVPGPDRLRSLEGLLHGYYSALSMHGVVERCPALDHHFSDWLQHRFRWSTSCGFADAVAGAHSPDDWDAFFRVLLEYRKLVPTVVAQQRNVQPKRPTSEIGPFKRQGSYDRVEIVQYVPEHLFHLRWHRGVWSQDAGFARDDGRFLNSASEVKEWAREQHGLEANGWGRAG